MAMSMMFSRHKKCTYKRTHAPTVYTRNMCTYVHKYAITCAGTDDMHTCVTHTHTRTHTQTQCAHMHTHCIHTHTVYTQTHLYTHTHTHTHTAYTHTHIINKI